ncbi:MAG: exodeoxyribonuclease VII large subunit [Firmicutes bacterium]|nr:exodeoxyribonuclease VII large subunit [Bacillota bacterium]
MVLTVTAISNYIKGLIETEPMLQTLSVEGEVFDYSTHGQSAYFTLKDADSSLRCVCFGYAQKRVDIKEGDNVILTGALNYYAKGGNVSLLVTSAKQNSKEGELLLAYKRLKEKLDREGYFKLAHKKPLPKYPQNIGVVTSKAGAVICDILNVVGARNRATNVVLYNVKVQGVGADLEIAEGIRVLDKGALDVIIVGRGGGSAEDLSAFNSEHIVRVVYNAKTPIISAVGHEADTSLTCYAADVCAATPSVAASLATFSLADKRGQIVNTAKQLKKNLNLLEQKKSSRLQRSISGCIYKLQNIQQRHKNKIVNLTSRLTTKMQFLQTVKKHRLEKLISNLDAASPIKILQKGYAKVYKKQKVSVASITSISKGDNLEVMFADGKIKAEVLDVKKYNK